MEVSQKRCLSFLAIIISLFYQNCMAFQIESLDFLCTHITTFYHFVKNTDHHFFASFITNSLACSSGDPFRFEVTFTLFGNQPRFSTSYHLLANAGSFNNVFLNIIHHQTPRLNFNIWPQVQDLGQIVVNADPNLTHKSLIILSGCLSLAIFIKYLF